MFKRLAIENNKYDKVNKIYECPFTTFSSVISTNIFLYF